MKNFHFEKRIKKGKCRKMEEERIEKGPLNPRRGFRIIFKENW